MALSYLSVLFCLLSAVIFASPLQRRAACPANFLNTVFNSAVNNEPDMTGRFALLQKYGISDWIGFTPNTVSASPAMEAGQIRLMLSTSDVPVIQAACTGDGAPLYSGTFNEPDGGFNGQAVYTAQEAYDAMLPLLQMKTKTRFLSPAAAWNTPPAGQNQTWLQQFMGICGSLCSDIIISIHVYNENAQGAIDTINTISSQFPGHEIWITELSFAVGSSSGIDAGCTMDQATTNNWMNTVLSHCVNTPGLKVARVFWNSGEYGFINPNNQALCNPSLTTTAGAATDLLQNYHAFCSGGGTPHNVSRRGEHSYGLPRGVQLI